MVFIKKIFAADSCLIRADQCSIEAVSSISKLLVSAMDC